MSTQAKNFTQAPNAFILQGKLKANEEKKMKMTPNMKVMMWILNAKIGQEQNKEVQISVKQMAEYMEVSPNTVRSTRDQLSNAGIIVTRSKKLATKNNEDTYWTIIQNYEFELKEVEQETEKEEQKSPVQIVNDPTSKIEVPPLQNLNPPTSKIEDKRKDVLNTDLKIINTSFSIDIESELNDLAYRVFGERMTPTIKSNIISIYKKHCKDNKFNLEMYERKLEEVSQQTNITSFYKYLLASVENELAGKPSPAKKDFASSKPKNIVRKEIAPNWLDKQKENDEKYKKQNEEAESDPTWLEEKARMKAELMQLDQDLKKESVQ